MHALVFFVLATQAIYGTLANPLSKRAVGFIDPRKDGGSLLDDTGNGLGEPLNVIVSGLSSAQVLTDDGIVNYARAIGFSTECFGVHLGDPQSANLGDGHGAVNQTIELRQDFGDANVGTCLESLIGGNHFRVFRQNGPTANTGALFLAVSHEEDVGQGHTISPDGYNNGRDLLVASAVGRTSFKGVNYDTVAQNLTGLLAPGAAGINHGKDPSLPSADPSKSSDISITDIATDGIITLLTVTIV
ncbi:hypothetical protein HGRIS_002231 [Hohenbuehelia grisea]|uniref:Uncharacterized protein n=1 Tax=Hohenbuehelia grisea TaxID=104357 RepID=A0ABR3JKL4_9AGAR